MQDHFVFIISQFLYIPWNYATKQAAAKASLQHGDSCTPSITIVAAESFESHMTEHLKEQVSILYFSAASTELFSLYFSFNFFIRYLFMFI